MICPLLIAYEHGSDPLYAQQTIGLCAGYAEYDVPIHVVDIRWVCIALGRANFQRDCPGQLSSNKRKHPLSTFAKHRATSWILDVEYFVHEEMIVLKILITRI